MPSIFLQARGLAFVFPQQPVFDNFSTTIAAGITYIVGGESCGKSTLLRLFSGDLMPQAGSIEVFGMSSKVNLASNKKHVFWTDPRTDAHDQISPNDYFDLHRKVYPEFDEALLLEVIEGLSLSDHVAKSIYMLSAGSKRKVWLAAAFASGAFITLLDEPFAALDKASINFLVERLQRVAQHEDRAWIIADYEVPPNLSTIFALNLGL